MRVHRVLRQQTGGAWTLLPALAGDEQLIASAELALWQWKPLTDESTVRAAWTLLSAEERARATRYRLEQVQRRFIVTRAALRRLLGTLCERSPASLRFEYGEQGKPRLDGCPTLHFSLSHTEGLALCGVARSPLGVDVEAVRSLSVEDVSPFVFTAEERKVLYALPPASQQERFFVFWVRKEAYLKALGMGFAASPRQVTTTPAPSGWWITDFVPQPGYRAAVALPLLKGAERVVDKD